MLQVVRLLGLGDMSGGGGRGGPSMRPIADMVSSEQQNGTVSEYCFVGIRVDMLHRWHLSGYAALLTCDFL